jgi:hypothetical protein
MFFVSAISSFLFPIYGKTGSAPPHYVYTIRDFSYADWLFTAYTVFFAAATICSGPGVQMGSR